LIFSGKVKNVVYENDTFKIVKLVLDDTSKVVTVKGHFPVQSVSVGAWLCFEGEETTHSQYGKQIAVTRSPATTLSWSDDRILSALSANGVGPTSRLTLKQWATKEGKTLFELLGGDISACGLDEFGCLYVSSRWKSVRTYMEGATFMAEVGLPPSVVGEVWKTFGSDLEDLITTDPWVLVRVAGISFADADAVAMKMGVCLDSPGRVRGSILSCLRDSFQDGHVFSTTGQMVDSVERSVPGGVTPKQVAEGIAALRGDEQLVVDRETADVVALYDPWHHTAETFCAEELGKRASSPLDEDFLRVGLRRVGDHVRDGGDDIEDLSRRAIEVWASSRQVELSEPQLAACVTALTSPVSLLTGLPGTGKTTSLQAIVSVLKDAEIPFLLTAPTGIAAKRMALVTGSEAVTIHRAFGAKGFRKEEEERESTYLGIVGESKKKTQDIDSDWEFGPGRPHPAKFVVVDESSMVDLHMLHRLLSATSEDCRLLFVGDPYQLPSVGSGDVLRDLVKSTVFPHHHLTEIFRQEGTSGIVAASHAVHNGQLPESDGKDFIFISVDSDDEAAQTIVEIAKKLYSKRLNFQVLSPRHGGDVGVTNLNQRLRLALNPSVAGIGELRLGGAVVREGDRIMVVKNDYQMGVYNGDVGKVSRIDKKAKQIELKIFQGSKIAPRLVRYPFKDASRIVRLAYAQTVHKSQGQEYDVIVLPVLNSFGRQLQRNLFYTAVTRAKEKVFLVGSWRAVGKAVENAKAQQRNTLLAARLVGVCESLSGGK